MDRNFRLIFSLQQFCSLFSSLITREDYYFLATPLRHLLDLQVVLCDGDGWLSPLFVLSARDNIERRSGEKRKAANQSPAKHGNKKQKIEKVNNEQ
jgi:hypothetical protein